MNIDVPFQNKPDDSRLAIYDAAMIVHDAGYQCESISVIDGCFPMLFKFEQEIVLLGSRHFSDYDLFIEFKRTKWPNQGKELSNIREFCHDYYNVDVIVWDDGSLGFRRDLRDNVKKIDFMRFLTWDLSDFQEMLSAIEEREHYPGLDLQDETEMRQLFFYEVIDVSIKLGQLKI